MKRRARTRLTTGLKVATSAAQERGSRGPLVYRDRYGGKVWEIPQARTVSELFGDCDSAEDFQRRVAALADLIARLDPYDQLLEDERLDEAGNRVGSLVAFERLLALRGLGVDFPASDWRLAWLQVLTAFWVSVQQLRVAIQSGAAHE